MSIEERAAKVCLALNLPEHGVAFIHIKSALQEQDRDTRHACAEAVLRCEEDVSGECIWKDDAHAACMNATCE